MSANLLGRETSPYLLQHKDNPVAWRPWGPEALAEAAASDRPILLSIGYSACHWCHVMAHESFENEAIAALMNTLYVPIKLDREERPDLDAIYQHALSMMGQQGGWPLTMFLTPAAEPFFGGTYFPAVTKWGRPGFAEILQKVSAFYRQAPDKVRESVESLAGGLARLGTPRGGDGVGAHVLDRVAERLVRAMDPIHGGIGEAPKFPNCSILELLWRAWKRTGQAEYRDSVLFALERISQGGIYDHVGGGYSRYSVDAEWLVPHFEKMLYDNASLLDLLGGAYQASGNPLFRDRARETIDWLGREMKLPGGGFAASLDADSEHHEGKFYVWSEAEIDLALGTEAPLFKAHYDVSAGGNWEGATILNRSRRPARKDEATEARLAAARAILLDHRKARVRPDRDDKVLADWNGLAIAALANTSRIFGEPHWLGLARGAFDFVSTEMSTPDNRLRHSWCRGQTHPGTLDDHANMARAALALLEATADPRYLDHAEAWVAALERHFASAEGGYYFTADDGDIPIARIRAATDAAVPSGNGTMLQVLGRLYRLTGKTAYRDAADRLARAFSGEVDRNFFPLANYLNGIDFLLRPIEIVLVGQDASPTGDALLQVIWSVPLPNRILTRIAPNSTLPEGHPAAGKTEPGAYVCVGETCSLPVSNPAALRAMLASL
jgi:uncharacterized protein YyaL (SSP411 family)